MRVIVRTMPEKIIGHLFDNSHLSSLKQRIRCPSKWQMKKFLLDGK